MSNWISVEDKLPPNDVYVLVAVYDPRPKVEMFFIQIAQRVNTHWFDDKNGEEICTKYSIVKYWQALPDLPDGRNIKKDKEEIAEKAFTECHDHIKKVIHEYLDKDEITYEIWLSIHDATKSYLEENFNAVAGFLADQLTDKLQDIEIKFNLDKS